MPLLAAELASLLGTVRRPGDFFAAGTAELLAPSLAIEGVGPVALPLLYGSMLHGGGLWRCKVV